MWIKNTDGKKDAVLTMTVIAFTVVVVKVLLAGFSVKDWGVSFGTIDPGMVAALLTPTLGAYVARRYTDKTMESGEAGK